MISSISRSFTTSWCKPKNIDLTKLIDKNQVFKDTQQVSILMTTNRSNLPGDDILSTPSMIAAMDSFTSSLISNVLPNKYFPVVNKIQVFHKAPLRNGEKFFLEATISEYAPTSATFVVKGLNPSNNKVFGEAKIHIELVQKN